MRVLEDMKEVLEEQIKKIAKKGDAISPQELDNAYKAVDIIKDIETIDAMKRAEEEGYGSSYGSSYDYSGAGSYNYSRRMPYSYEGSYDGSYDGRSYADHSMDGRSMNMSRGRDGDGDGRYSERRGRDARTGRFVSRDGGSYDNSYEYSREPHQDKEQMKRQIQEMQKKLEQM